MRGSLFPGRTFLDHLRFEQVRKFLRIHSRLNWSWWARRAWLKGAFLNKSWDYSANPMPERRKLAAYTLSFAVFLALLALKRRAKEDRQSLLAQLSRIRIGRPPC